MDREAFTMIDNSTKVLQHVQVLAIAIVVIGSFVLAGIGPFTDIATEGAIWILIGLVGTLSLYLLATNILFEKRIEKIEKGPQTSTMLSQKEWYESLIPFVKSAKESIDITHHEPRTPMISGIEAKKELFNALSKKIKESEVLVRWIIAINSIDKLDWTIELLEEHKNCNNFSLRYSQVDLNYCSPPQSVQIIDDKVGFVIDMSKGHHSASELDTDLFTEDPSVIGQLKRFYDCYWNRCHVLKEGSKIYHDEIEKLKNLENQCI